MTDLFGIEPPEPTIAGYIALALVMLTGLVLALVIVAIVTGVVR